MGSCGTDSSAAKKSGGGCCGGGGSCGPAKPKPADAMPTASVVDSVKDYYGKVLEKTQDLKTNACVTGAAPADHVKAALKNVHDEVLAKYYGCGILDLDVLDGAHVLDLGSGSGRDCYALAQWVGEQGRVVGVDMTDEQLDVANRHLDWHRAKFGYATSNVRFLKGYIEKLHELDLEAGSFDVITSNCVINLSPDKEAVLREAHRLLKPGGMLEFADVYADRRVPDSLRADPVLWGECLSGALYWADFEAIARRCGFSEARVMKDSRVSIGNSALEAKIGHIGFYSVTYRLAKLPEDELDAQPEDYGQAVMYKGSIAHRAERWALSDDAEFLTGKVTPVSGNTFATLQLSRFAPHFEFFGSKERHFGPFTAERAGQEIPFATARGTGGASAKEAAPSSCC